MDNFERQRYDAMYQDGYQVPSYIQELKREIALLNLKLDAVLKKLEENDA